jgi:hypothetical protein
MTRTTALRRIIRIIAVVLAMSTTAGSASATPFDPNTRDSLAQQPAHSIVHTNAPAAAGSSVDWGYIAIGSSAVALALIGAGVAVTSRRRSREDRPRRATIAG